MNRFRVITVAVCLAAFAVSLAAAGPVAAGKRSCNIDGRQTELGASYVTSVQKKGVSCRKAIRVVKAFHKCRQENGGSDGRCKGRVKGFKCEEDREGVPNIQYNSEVTCRDGDKRVWQTYTQNV